MEDAGIPNPYSRQEEEQPFGYTGYRRDDISGTYFAQAREYQPQNGRFTAEDVIKGNGAAPETLNQYGYCWGNPIIYIDRTGMIAYIIYDDYSFDENNNQDIGLKEYAFKIEKERLEKLYGEAPIMCPVTSLEEEGDYNFADVWMNKIGYDKDGNVVEVDEVSIIAHGNKYGIYFHGDSLNTNYLKDYPKEMKRVTLISCNAGNIDNEANIARTFLMTQNVEEVVAWDGVVGLYTYVFRTCGLHIDQQDFYEYEEKRIINILGFEIEWFSRCPMGRLVYKLDENGEEIVLNSEGRRVYYECPD